MSRIAKIILGIAGALISALFVLGLLISSDCSKDSEGYKFAKSLSQEQLTSLYKFVQLKVVESDKQSNTIWFTPDDNIPELSGIKFKNLRISKIYSRMVFEGCMDHYVMLSFRGMQGTEPKTIKLSSGEQPTWELVWQQ